MNTESFHKDIHFLLTFCVLRVKLNVSNQIWAVRASLLKVASDSMSSGAIYSGGVRVQFKVRGKHPQLDPSGLAVSLYNRTQKVASLASSARPCWLRCI